MQSIQQQLTTRKQQVCFLLKRFTFNAETLSKRKVHDAIQFPSKLEVNIRLLFIYFSSFVLFICAQLDSFIKSGDVTTYQVTFFLCVFVVVKRSIIASKRISVMCGGESQRPIGAWRPLRRQRIRCADSTGEAIDFRSSSIDCEFSSLGLILLSGGCSMIQL